MKYNTPLQKLKFSCNNNIYMKRDDLLPFSFGGNKARKAEYFFEDILRKSCDVVVTYGSHSSNHCRIIANMAVRNGLKCIIISPAEDYHETSNSKMVNLFGARVIMVPLNEVAQTIDKTMEELKEKHNPYFIQGGGHGNLGTEAYVDAYKEILDFEKENNISFDYIFHASGTGTTQAGLVCGQILSKREGQKIIGISIARQNPRGKDVVIESVNSYLGDGKDYKDIVKFTDDYICGGYGKYNQGVIDTIKELLINDGITLNTTYTGKAFWGMTEFIKEKNIQNKNILFINTGGTPLFFDDLEELCK